MVYYDIFDEAFLESLQQPDVVTALAAKFEFPSGTTRVHSAPGTIVIAGEAYFGVGALGEISVVTEDGNLATKNLNVSLSGLDTSILGTVMNEKCVGSPAEVFFVTFNSLGQTIAANVLYSGYISGSGLTAGDVNAVSYTLSNVFEKWKEGNPARYTEESHVADFPGDHIFRYVAQMAERPIYWGSVADAVPFSRFK